MEETDMVQTIPFPAEDNPISVRVANACPANLMTPEDRQDLALQALSGTCTITALAEQTGVSRKFVYQQIEVAQQALTEAFAAADDDEVLGYLPVTKKWLRQNVLSLVLNCRSSFRGVIHHFQDCLHQHIAIGTIYNIIQDAVVHARTYNTKPSLAMIDCGLLDEIFQAQQPVLVGVDAASTYCFLLSQETQRDGVTWGVRLLELQERGLDPEAFVADFGSGLRAGCDLAFADTPCWGDVFHGLHKVMPVVSTLENQAYQAIAARDDLERKAAQHRRRQGRADPHLTAKLVHAKPKEEQAIALADDVAILADWLRAEVFAVAGPSGTDRRLLYDFIVAELRARVAHGGDRLTQLCTFLDNHRDQLLGFADQLDRQLAELAHRFHVTVDTVRACLRLQQLSHANPCRWQREAQLRQQLQERFHDLNEAVRELAHRTVRASSLVENLNSRLRNYFTLRRHLGVDYLALLQFFFNHRRFDRSECPERAGKSPAELLTGQTHPHWLAMLGYQPLSPN
jgi:two-component sensor histidine kinase